MFINDVYKEFDEKCLQTGIRFTKTLSFCGAKTVALQVPANEKQLNLLKRFH